MKIKEFSIIRYGPLPNTGRILLNNFNLFWGKNEDGKTLTIDALVKLLLLRNIRGFERIERVEENPEGYVIIEDDKGKEIKLPEKGDLTKVVGLTPSECRNIFIIRNSDLSIARESEFYTNVTDRLTGLRTEEISSIKKRLQELGKLTRAESNAVLSNSKDFGKIKDRVNSACRLIEEIDNLQERIKKANFDELEKDVLRIEEERNGIGQKIESFEDARKREKYEKGKTALDTLTQVLEGLEKLEPYNEDDLRLWKTEERTITDNIEERENQLGDLREKEKELKEKSEKLEKLKRDFHIFEERRKKIDDEIKLEIKEYEIKDGELEQQRVKSKFFTHIIITSAVLLSISILGIIIRPSLLFYILTAIFLISTGIFGTLQFLFVRNKAWLAGMFERIKLNTSKFDLGGESVEEILSNIQKFSEEYSKREGGLKKIEGEVNLLEHETEKLKEEIPKKEKKSRDAEEKINDIKRKSGVESSDEYDKKLKLKANNETTKESQISILTTQFSSRGKTLEEKISYWTNEIIALKGHKDKANGIEYDEKSVSKLKEEEKSCKEKLDEIKEKMSGFHKDLEEIERNANKTLQLEADYLHCKTSVDLDAVRDKLQEFINENESNKNNVLKVMEFFEEIETEEKEKVSELFGKDSSISKYFNRITDELYEEVLFNQEIGKIEVRRKDAVILEAEKLSGGAYDQLYLSIRLALGEKLLKGEKGFFIMDDPFVKADPDRLQRQIEMLKKTSELGWQVMYFSAKGEVRDALEEDIKKGAVNHVEIQSIFS